MYVKTKYSGVPEQGGQHVGGHRRTQLSRSSLSGSSTCTFYRWTKWVKCRSQWVAGDRAHKKKEQHEQSGEMGEPLAYLRGCIDYVAEKQGRNLERQQKCVLSAVQNRNLYFPSSKKQSHLKFLALRSIIKSLGLTMTFFPFPDFKPHLHPTPNPKQMLNITGFLSFLHSLC